jgi:hypothetical protein
VSLAIPLTHAVPLTRSFDHRLRLYRASRSPTRTAILISIGDRGIVLDVERVVGRDDRARISQRARSGERETETSTALTPRERRGATRRRRREAG